MGNSCCIESSKPRAISVAEHKIINTWSAGGWKGKDQGWSQITFEKYTSGGGGGCYPHLLRSISRGAHCKGTIVLGQKKTVFKGEGTWKLDGPTVVVNWTSAERDGKALSEKERSQFSTLHWNGANGCSLIWCFDGKRQALLPTEHSKYRSDDKYYGGQDYASVGSEPFLYDGKGQYSDEALTVFGAYWIPSDPNDGVVARIHRTVADGGECIEDEAVAHVVAETTDHHHDPHHHYHNPHDPHHHDCPLKGGGDFDDHHDDGDHGGHDDDHHD